MNVSHKVKIALTILFTLVIIAAIWWFAGSKSIVSMGNSQSAAIAAALLSADDFAVLAGSTITNTGDTVIEGDLGLSPGTSVTGFPPGIVNGTQHVTDAEAADAQTDLTEAYNDAAGQDSTASISGDLAGETLIPGVYTSGSSIGLTGVLTLDGEGDPNAVFIFQAGSTLTTGPGSEIVLINNAQACNVFWQVGSSATLGTNSTFKGTILALESITLTTGADIEGRALAQGGAVTLDTNTITVPSCVSAATLHVIKLVVNANDGAAVPEDFTVYVQDSGDDVVGSPANGTTTPGTTYSLTPGTYVISEDEDPLYTQSFSGACDSNGSITLAEGDDEICTIINTDIPPPAAVSSGGGGGSRDRIVPLIGIKKIPNPLALPDGSGSVTYNYTVWNVGRRQTLVNITVTDDKCDSIVFVSGDEDDDEELDTDESWKYRCTMTLSNTTTNTAIATGYSNDSYHEVTIATALATVVVGKSVAPPLIDIVKVPNRLTPFLFGGGEVIYTYTVTNPGIVALHDVTVSDDKCTAISNPSGDTNDNDLLDTSETWIYTCQMHIPVSTRNVAMAEGRANGFTALDYAFADVLVATPGLPSAGFPPSKD